MNASGRNTTMQLVLEITHYYAVLEVTIIMVWDWVYGWKLGLVRHKTELLEILNKMALDC